MLILATFTAALQQWAYHMEGATATEMLAGSRLMEHLAQDLCLGEITEQPAPQGRGLSGTFTLEIAGDRTVDVEGGEPGDVVVAISWPPGGGKVQMDYLACVCPTWEQAGAMAAMLDEAGRHQYRTALAKEAVERAQRIASMGLSDRQAIERAAARVDVGRA